MYYHQCVRWSECQLDLIFLSYQQLADELQNCENIALHLDGTSKFGQHYGSFQISTETAAYLLGLSQMLTGTARQTLDLFMDILSDFEETVGSNAKRKLLQVPFCYSEKQLIFK